MDEAEAREFGRWLRAVRGARSRQRIVDLAGLSISTVQNYEDGGRRYKGQWVIAQPDDRTLAKLARALDVTVEEIFERAGKPLRGREWVEADSLAPRVVSGSGAGVGGAVAGASGIVIPGEIIPEYQLGRRVASLSRLHQAQVLDLVERLESVEEEQLRDYLDEQALMDRPLAAKGIDAELQAELDADGEGDGC